MTQGVAMLKALCAKRTLRKLCKVKAVSYKFAHGVVSQRKMPSMDMMAKFRDIIPIRYWFTAADKDFKKLITNLLLNEDDDKPIIVDLSEKEYRRKSIEV